MHAPPEDLSVHSHLLGFAPGQPRSALQARGWKNRNVARAVADGGAVRVLGLGAREVGSPGVERADGASSEARLGLGGTQAAQTPAGAVPHRLQAALELGVGPARYPADPRRPQALGTHAPRLIFNATLVNI